MPNATVPAIPVGVIAGVEPGCGRMVIDDPAVHEQLTRPWELVITPLSATGYRYSMQYLSVPGFSLYREHVNAPVRLRGRSPPGMLTFLVPLQTAPDSTYWKHSLPGTGMALTLPAAVDGTFGRGESHFIGLVDLELLRRSLPGGMLEMCDHGPVVTCAPDGPGANRRLSIWFEQVCFAAAQDGTLLRNPSVVRGLQAQLLQQLYRYLQTRSDAEKPPALTTRHRVIDRALDRMHAEDSPVLSVLELSTAIGVSQRTLQYAFESVFDVTPLTYLRMHRLHAARRRLITAGSTQHTVTRIAHDLGFWHLARFAAAYRAQFGELPSVTMARCRGMRSVE